MSEQIYFIQKCIKEKQIFWFRMSLLFYSWPLSSLGSLSERKKKAKPENVLTWGFHHSDSDLGGLILQGLEKPEPLQQACSSQHASLHRFWESRGIVKPVPGIPTAATDRKRLFLLYNCLSFHKCDKFKAKSSSPPCRTYRR